MAWRDVLAGRTWTLDPVVRSMRLIMFGLGSLLVITGALLMLYFGLLIYDIASHPGDVALVTFIRDAVDSQAPFLSGGTDRASFTLAFSEPAEFFAYLVLGIFALSVMGNIVKALIWSGVEIVKVAWREQAPGQPQPPLRDEPRPAPRPESPERRSTTQRVRPANRRSGLP